MNGKTEDFRCDNGYYVVKWATSYFAFITLTHDIREMTTKRIGRPRYPLAPQFQLPSNDARYTQNYTLIYMYVGDNCSVHVYNS